ncbi:MAG: hypothetical protein AB7E96_10780 [Deferribacterales bacterium]
MANIAFTGNHSRTVTFHAVSQHLDATGVFWIMPGARFRIKYLTDHGVNRADILNLAEIKPETDIDILSELERFSDVSAAYIISCDRLLSRKNRDYAYGYLCAVYKSVKKFITDSKIDIIFSEATWAFELVTCAAARSCGAEFLVPHTVRYPKGRFVFFRGIFQKEIFNTGRSVSVTEMPSLSGGTDVIMPKLVSGRNFSGLFRHLLRYVSEKYDDTSHTPFQLIRDRAGRYINAGLIRFGGFSGRPEGKYVYFPLHCQPEASIDVLGGFYSDQLSLIRAVSKSLPSGIILAVKEHPKGIGMRRPSFFREIDSLPNTVNVSPFTDSAEIIKGAEAVVSVSGTACYEAALSGVGSVVFSDVFFAGLPAVFRCRGYDNLADCLVMAVSAVSDRQSTARFLEKMSACSYSGSVEPYDFDNDVIKEENARACAKAFMDVIDYSSSRPLAAAASMSSR